MLELELIELSEPLRAFEIGWLPFFFELDFFAKCILQPAFDQIDREIRNVDSDPLPPELLRSVNRRPASAERIENYIAGIARCVNYPFEESNRFLRSESKFLVAASFLQPSNISINSVVRSRKTTVRVWLVCPDVLQRHTATCVQVLAVFRQAIDFRRRQISFFPNVIELLMKPEIFDSQFFS